jgi:hypothetical protein
MLTKLRKMSIMIGLLLAIAAISLVVIAATIADKTAPKTEVRVRPAAVAGTWYPDDAQVLGKLVDELLVKASPRTHPKGVIRALLAPHAGYQYSGATAAAGYQLLKGQNPSRVIVIGPSHHGDFHGLSILEVTHYETPLGRLPLDLKAIAQLRKSSLVVADAQADEREHSIEIQLPLLQRVLTAGWKLVPILVGQMSAKDYAKAADLLRPLADDQTLIILSGDFTHYGPNYDYLPFPPDDDDTIKLSLKQLDMGAYDKIVAHDAAGLLAYREMTGITACAFGPVMILLNMLPDNATPTLVKYYTSGELTANYNNSVSYLAVAITSEQPFATVKAVKSKTTPPDSVASEVKPKSTASDSSSDKNQKKMKNLSESQMKFLHQLARQAVEAAVVKGQDPEKVLTTLASRMPEELQKPAGAFITLKELGELRGCIGHIFPKEPLYRAVVINAINAAQHDPRFYPVQAEELPEIELEVSVLTPPQPIASYHDFEIGKHGIILKKDGRAAVFLPEVAVEQNWNREQTLSQLAKKAGLPPDAWQTGAKFEVFTTQTYTAPQVPVVENNPTKEIVPD